MKKKKKRILRIKVLLILLLSGCATSGFFTDHEIRQGISSSRIHIGATQNEVRSIVGSPPPGCSKSKVNSEGKWEMWDYATRFCGSNWSESYVLIFKNGQLEEIRTVKNIQDMQF